MKLSMALLLLLALSSCDFRVNQVDANTIAACSKACVGQGTWMARVTNDSCVCSKPGVSP